MFAYEIRNFDMMLLVSWLVRNWNRSGCEWLQKVGFLYWGFWCNKSTIWQYLKWKEMHAWHHDVKWKFDRKCNSQTRRKLQDYLTEFWQKYMEICENKNDDLNNLMFDGWWKDYGIIDLLCHRGLNESQVCMERDRLWILNRVVKCAPSRNYIYHNLFV